MQLGEGAHGVVYLAKLSDMYVAVKVRPAEEESMQETLCTSVQSLVHMLRRRERLQLR